MWYFLTTQIKILLFGIFTAFHDTIRYHLFIQHLKELHIVMRAR